MNSYVKYYLLVALWFFSLIVSIWACFDPSLLAHKWPNQAHFPNNIFYGLVMAVIAIVNLFYLYKKLRQLK